jgi:hypothetical protein
MSNFFDLRCPKCSSENEIDVQAAVWLRLTEDGTDADAAECGDHEYNQHSPATCNTCGYIGKLRDFEQEEAAATEATGECVSLAIMEL